MRKMSKTVFVVLAVITSCSVFAGIIDRAQQKKREMRAVQEGRTIHKPYGPYEKYFKRPLDFWFSAFALVLLFPVLILIAVSVRLKLGPPVLFTQDRPGRDERIFVLKKFRTMTDARDENGKLLGDDERVTKLGWLLRTTSLDELPELWNIVKGEMSIIGPRPLLVEYLPAYTEEEKHRHDVRPGLSGLAQVNGRNNASWERIFYFDIAYVNKITFMGDLKILLHTVRKIIKREDIVIFNKDNSEKLNEVRLGS